MLRGVQVVQGKEGRAPQARLPVTPSMLRKLKAVWEGRGNSYDNIMWWAVAATTFFTFCRLGEMVVERGFV